METGKGPLKPVRYRTHGLSVCLSVCRILVGCSRMRTQTACPCPGAPVRFTHLCCPLPPLPSPPGNTTRTPTSGTTTAPPFSTDLYFRPSLTEAAAGRQTDRQIANGRTAAAAWYVTRMYIKRKSFTLKESESDNSGLWVFLFFLFYFHTIYLRIFSPYLCLCFFNFQPCIYFYVIYY